MSSDRQTGRTLAGVKEALNASERYREAVWFRVHEHRMIDYVAHLAAREMMGVRPTLIRGKVHLSRGSSLVNLVTPTKTLLGVPSHLIFTDHYLAANGCRPSDLMSHQGEAYQRVVPPRGLSTHKPRTPDTTFAVKMRMRRLKEARRQGTEETVEFDGPIRPEWGNW